MTLLLTLDDGSIQRRLASAVDFARDAVLENAPEVQVGTHVGASREDAVTVSHLFEAEVPGYRGWRWSVTVALAGDDEPVTVSEVVLVPGPDAMIAPAWVPWERRVRAGDLGVGDIFPTDKDDPRLVPAYLASDDPAVEEVAHEAGLGRVHVLSRFGREDAATRWHGGEFGPRSDMARSAPDVCGTCGFFVPLAGSLRGTFGACTNDIAPADGHVVDVEYGCGAHSEVEVEVTSSVPVAELVYDDSLLDFTSAEEVAETAAAEAEPETVEADETDTIVVARSVIEAVDQEIKDAAAAPEVPEVADAAPAEAEAEPVVAEGLQVAAAEAVEAEAAAEPEVAEAPPVEVEPEPAEVPDVATAEVVEAEPAVEPEVAEAPSVEVEAEPVVAETPEVAEAPSVEVTEPEQVEDESSVPEFVVDEPVVVERLEVAEAAPAEVEPETEVAESAPAEATETAEAVADEEDEPEAVLLVEPIVDEDVAESAEPEVPEAAVTGAVVTEPEPESEPQAGAVEDATTPEASEAAGDQRDA